MQVLEGLTGLRSLPPGAVLSVGNFDGIHRGHQRILGAARYRADAEPGERSGGRYLRAAPVDRTATRARAATAYNRRCSSNRCSPVSVFRTW